MKKVLFCLLTIIIFTGCKDEPTKPEELSEGYQQDIPWPGLANSPWPIFHADPQNTGRSKYAGPLSGKVLYKINAESMVSAPVLGLENILYFRTESATSLNAVKNYTEVLWSKERGFEEPTVPVVRTYCKIRCRDFNR